MLPRDVTEMAWTNSRNSMNPDYKHTSHTPRLLGQTCSLGATNKRTDKYNCTRTKQQINQISKQTINNIIILPEVHEQEVYINKQCWTHSVHAIINFKMKLKHMQQGRDKVCPGLNRSHLKLLLGSLTTQIHLNSILSVTKIWSYY